MQALALGNIGLREPQRRATGLREREREVAFLDKGARLRRAIFHRDTEQRETLGDNRVRVEHGADEMRRVAALAHAREVRAERAAALADAVATVAARAALAREKPFAALGRWDR